MLIDIPVISPITISLATHREAGDRLLTAGADGEALTADETEFTDYTVQELSAPKSLSGPAALTGPAPLGARAPGAASQRDEATAALRDIERAVAVSEYHDFEWWRSRIVAIRTVLESETNGQ